MYSGNSINAVRGICWKRNFVMGSRRLVGMTMNGRYVPGKTNPIWVWTSLPKRAFPFAVSFWTNLHYLGGEGVVLNFLTVFVRWADGWSKAEEVFLSPSGIVVEPLRVDILDITWLMNGMVYTTGWVYYFNDYIKRQSCLGLKKHFFS